jgi:tetratricopeptide (TPR) repeat protein
VETVRRNVLFDKIAFITVMKDRKICAQVPLAIVEDRPVSLAVPVTTDPGALLAEHRDAWTQNVRESYFVQTRIFKEINAFSAKPETRGQSVEVAQAGLQRTRSDHSRLTVERQQVLDEARQLGLKPPDLTAGDNYLEKLKSGEVQLEEHIARMREIEEKEKDPIRQKWLARVATGKLEEKELNYQKAIEEYRNALKEGFQSDELRKHVDDLEKRWHTDDPNLKQARVFIYDVWPDLDRRGLQKRMADAEKALEACRTAGDFIGPRKMLKAADVHVGNLSKELSSLSEVNIDDEKPIREIQALAPQLQELIKAIEQHLKKAPPEK